MNNKSKAMLRDAFWILFCCLYASWSFAFINWLVVLFMQPFLLVPAAFIRPSDMYKFKMKKIAWIIAILPSIVIAIDTFKLYKMGFKSSDSSLWPFEIRLTIGLCFLTQMIFFLYKLFLDMKVPEEDEI